MERSQMDYDVYVGMDVGKCEDYVVALARDGDERLIDSPVSQSECDLRAVPEKLQLRLVRVGPGLCVVEQGEVGEVEGELTGRRLLGARREVAQVGELDLRCIVFSDTENSGRKKAFSIN